VIIYKKKYDTSQGLMKLDYQNDITIVDNYFTGSHVMIINHSMIVRFSFYNVFIFINIQGKCN